MLSTQSQRNEKVPNATTKGTNRFTEQRNLSATLLFLRFRFDKSVCKFLLITRL